MLELLVPESLLSEEESDEDDLEEDEEDEPDEDDLEEDEEDEPDEDDLEMDEEDAVDAERVGFLSLDCRLVIFFLNFLALATFCVFLLLVLSSEVKSSLFCPPSSVDVISVGCQLVSGARSVVFAPVLSS